MGWTVILPFDNALGSFVSAMPAMSEQSESNGKFLFFTYRLMVSNIIFLVNYFSNIIHNDTA